MSNTPCFVRPPQKYVTAFLSIILIIGSGGRKAYSQSGGGLVRLSSTTIAKERGWVDQVVLLPDGGFLVRDSGDDDPQAMAIQVFDRQGHYIRAIGSPGNSPGQYYALASISMGRDGTVWAADASGRVTRFSQDGRVLRSTLMQNPTLNVWGLALDEARGVVYLSGCIPTKTYLDLGCHLVHQYGLADMSFKRSYLDTDPAAIQNHLFSLERYHIDVDAAGRVWAVDSALLELYRIDPLTGRTISAAISSRLAKPLQALNPQDPWDAKKAVRDGSYMVDRVMVAGSRVVVSIKRPNGAGYLLSIFTLDGHQVAQDVESAAKLVGKTSAGRLYFANRSSNGFEISQYEVGHSAAK
jgi:hypothetical protein